MRRGLLVVATATVAVLALAPVSTPAAGAGVSAAPPRVTHATATTVSSTHVALRWTNPATADFAATIVRFKRGTTAPTPSTGVKVARLPAPHHAITVPRLAPGRAYTFALFAADGHGHLAPARILHARTAPAPVTDVRSYGLGTDVSLQWTNPLTPTFRGVVVRYLTGTTAPSRPSLGRIVHLPRSKSTSVTLRHLAKGTTYSVAIWARDAALRRSSVRTTSFTIAAAPPPPGTVSGRVTDDAHHPLAGVRLSAFNLSAAANFSAVTDSSGHYTLTVPAEKYYVVASGPNATGGNADTTGYVPQILTVNISASTDATRNFTLHPGGAITGKVTDTDGRPLAGVVPELVEPPTYVQPDSGGGFWSSFLSFIGGTATTASDGTFAIRGVGKDAYIVCYETTAEAITGGASDLSAYANNCQSGSTTVAPGGTKTVPDIRLASTPGGAVSGSVTDTSGTGVAGADVFLSQLGSSGLVGVAMTGQHGTYHAQGLAPGRYRVCVDTSLVDNLRTQTTPAGVVGACRPNPVTVTAGQSTTADVTLPTGAAFEGTVTGPHGQPLADASITIAQSRYDRDYVAHTDADGQYRASGLTPGRVAICVDASGLPVRGVATGAASACYRRRHKVTKLTLRRGAVLSGINFTLRPAAAIIGTVTDADGRPMVGADVEVRGTESFVDVEAQTGTSGRYSAPGLPAGSYEVCVSTEPAGGAADMRCAQPKKKLVAGSLLRRNFVFAPAGFVTVSVHDQHGRSVAGIDAVVLAQCGGHHHACAPQPVFSATQRVSVRASGPTDGNGRFRFGGLHAGRYAVCLFAYFAATTANDADTGYADTCSGHTLDVTVTKGHTTTVPLTLAHGGAVTGKVTDGDGHSLPGVRVHVTGAAADDYAPSHYLDPDTEFTPTADSVTHADGTYTIRAVRPGTPKVCFDAAEATAGSSTGGYRDRCLSTTVAADATATVNAALPGAGAITGTVTGAGGHPLGEVEVLLLRDGNALLSTETQDDGTYRLARLATASDYEVCFLGYRLQSKCYDNVAWPDSDKSPPPGTPVAVTAGATTSGINAQLKRSSS